MDVENGPVHMGSRGEGKERLGQLRVTLTYITFTTMRKMATEVAI